MPERMTSQNVPTSAKSVPVTNAEQHAVSIVRQAAAAKAAEDDAKRRLEAQAAAAQASGLPSHVLPAALKPRPAPEPLTAGYVLVAEGEGIQVKGLFIHELGGLLLVAISKRGQTSVQFVAMHSGCKLGVQPASLEKVEMQQDANLTLMAATVPELGGVILVTSGQDVSCTFAPRPV